MFLVTLVNMIFGAKKQNLFLANLMMLISKMTLAFHS